MNTNRETIINALTTYKSYMAGLSRSNSTRGDIEYANYCTIEAHKAEEVLKELQGEME